MYMSSCGAIRLTAVEKSYTLYFSNSMIVNYEKVFYDGLFYTAEKNISQLHSLIIAWSNKAGKQFLWNAMLQMTFNWCFIFIMLQCSGFNQNFSRDNISTHQAYYYTSRHIRVEDLCMPFYLISYHLWSCVCNDSYLLASIKQVISSLSTYFPPLVDHLHLYPVYSGISST